MKPSNVAFFLLICLLACSVYFFWHFTVPVLAAGILCFASWPLYRRIELIFKPGSLLAPVSMLSIWLIALVLPLTYVGVQTVQEAQHFIGVIAESNRMGVGEPAWIKNIPIVGEQAAAYWAQNLAAPGQLEGWLKSTLGASWNDISHKMLSITSSLGGFALSMLFCFITLFFLYKDGKKVMAQIDVVGEHSMPTQWFTLSRLIPKTVSATVLGMSTIAIAEGVILGIAYYLAGAPAPLVLGVITAFMAMIPGGAPLAFTSVSAYLIATGNSFEGVCLFVWGSVELFVIDKSIRPMLVGGPVKLPFLPTFFGLIGGVKTMGLIGLFIGPVLMALVVSIWRSWVFLIKEKRQMELDSKNVTDVGDPASSLRSVS